MLVAIPQLQVFQEFWEAARVLLEANSDINMTHEAQGQDSVDWECT